MNTEQRYRDGRRGVWWSATGRRRLLRQCLVALTAVSLACGLAAESRSQTPGDQETGRSMPDATAFPELADVFRSVDQFVFGNTILVGKGDPAKAHDAQPSFDPIPAQSRVVAFEENKHFLYVAADASHIVSPTPRVQANETTPTLVRRFLFLKPSVFVVDDAVRQSAPGKPLRWLLGCRNVPTIAGRQLCVTHGDQQLVCETLWPATKTLQRIPGPRKASEAAYQIEVEPQADASEVRWLHVFDLRPAASRDAPVKSALEQKDGRFELTIAASNRTFRLSLPPPGVDGGQIAVDSADGETTVARRPLPAGVLPHGPKGIRLIERWDSPYRNGNRPAWDTGVPAEDLKQAVEKGVIRPCRTVVVGCGSGTNAIYLASRGFDVTAIDVAPTALSIAQAKAQEAGVRVRWLLADVLALPKLAPFDFIFDRGCYHNVRYVDAAGLMESLRRLSRPGTRCLVLSLNRDGPPGVREQHMRDDFTPLFEFESLRESGIQTGAKEKTRRPSWSVMLVRKLAD